MNTTHRNTECIPQQIRVFSKWVSNNLSKYKSYTKVSDVTKDFKNGLNTLLSRESMIKHFSHNWLF